MNHALEVTSFLHEDCNFRDFKAIVICEDPNANLYSFVGSIDFKEQRDPLSSATSSTFMTEKVIQNSTDPPSKRSKIEKKMDRII
ncbi:putative phospholipid-transporting ATPase 9 [Fagus crenata]